MGIGSYWIARLTGIPRARRLGSDAGNIVCLFADGGWKYLSTQLWTSDYEDLPSDIDDKIWW